MQSICHYLTDSTGDLLLWHLKHKELIRLFSRYYAAEELQAFFHPMTGEEVPFKSLVLAHYMKANDTRELADLVRLRGSHLPPHLQGGVRDGCLSMADPKTGGAYPIPPFFSLYPFP